jgi:hypothetical protein
MNKEYCSDSGMKPLSLMQKSSILILAAIILFFGIPPFLHSGQAGTLEGRIIDAAQEPMRNAEVYVFDSSDTKRPADFISNRTVEDGRYRVQLPAGNYWAVAIYRTGDARFGPLGPEDRHSGDPVAFEIAAEDSRSMNFVVMNLREAAKQHEKRNEDLIKVTGRVLDQSGDPVQMAYAIAHGQQQFGILPDHISAWTDDTGEYVLYLEPGKYFLGALVGFPPKKDYILYLDQQFTGDTGKVDLIVDHQKR